MISEDELRAAFDNLADVLLRAVREATTDKPKPDRLLSVTEAAAQLGIGKTMAYSEIGTGRLRSLKVGNRRLVAASAVTEYIERRQNDAA